MTPDIKPEFSVRTEKPHLVEKIKQYMGEEFVNMSPEVAAQFDTGDLEESDPRIRASNMATGRWKSMGGSGPKKE